jgi:hypothetical protein
MSRIPYRTWKVQMETTSYYDTSVQKGVFNALISSELTTRPFIDTIIASQSTHWCNVLVPSTVGFEPFSQKNVTSDDMSGWHMKTALMRSKQ